MPPQRRGVPPEEGAGTPTGGRGDVGDESDDDFAEPSSDDVKYLLSYEGMVRRQDAEHDAASEHLGGAFERIRALGGGKEGGWEEGAEPGGGGGLTLTYPEMRRCLLRLGAKWERSLPANDGGDDDDDDVSVLSLDSAGPPRPSEGRDVIATDSQLVLLLATLAEAEERHRESRTASGGNKEGGDRPRQNGLFLPEFVQAYKIIVGGMQSSNSISNSVLRQRLKARTLAMIRPFGPDFKMYDDGSPTSEIRARGGKSPRDGTSSTTNDLTEGEMKRVMRSKDNVLARIVEDHESEMDALNSGIDRLRLGQERARAASRRRRKLARLAALILLGAFVAAGLAAEWRRREFLEGEIASGREAERIANLRLIGELEEERKRLGGRLEVIRGKMRYQVGRGDEIEAKLEEVQSSIDDLDARGSIAKAEREECVGARAQSNDALKIEGSRGEGSDEELAWCESRLRSRERELNELKHVAHEAARDGDDERATAIAHSAEEGEEGDDSAAPTGGEQLRLATKYDPSARRAVLLRQAYSAAAGLAASLVVRAALGLFAPGAAVVVPPPPPPEVLVKGAEMAVVDGISASSIAFLVLRALAVFVMPL